MKLLRAALCLVAISLPAQSPEIARAHLAYDAFAKLANAWRDGHNDSILNLQDNQRLEDAATAWDKFIRLAKEAGWTNHKRKARF